MTAIIAWKPLSTDINTASYRFRTYMPCSETKKRGWPVELFDIQNVHNYKIVIFQKAYSKEDFELAKHLKKQGIVIVFDMCDNHFYNPQNIDKYTRRAQDMTNMINLADHVIASTEALAEIIPKESVFQVDDYMDKPDNNLFYKWYNRYKMPRLFKKRGMTDRLKLVWFGNAGIVSQDYGLKDIQLVLPELIELNKTLPLSLTIISNCKNSYHEFVGYNQPFPTMFCRWKKHYFYHQLPQFDICLIPARMNAYTRVKTNNRVSLSLSLGVPVIASPLPSYLPFEPYIDFENWQNNIKKLATDPALAKKKVQAGQNYIESHCNIQAITDQWSTVLLQLCAEHKITNEEINKFASNLNHSKPDQYIIPAFS